MNVSKAELKISAVGPDQYPEENWPELAFAGRSNVGKSSFINTITQRKKNLLIRRNNQVKRKP